MVETQCLCNPTSCKFISRHTALIRKRSYTRSRCPARCAAQKLPAKWTISCFLHTYFHSSMCISASGYSTSQRLSLSVLVCTCRHSLFSFILAANCLHVPRTFSHFCLLSFACHSVLVHLPPYIIARLCMSLLIKNCLYNRA